MSKESEKHVDRVLDQISTRLESLTVSGPKLGDLSTLRSHMLRLLDKVSEQEIVDWAHDHMAAYKSPRIVSFAESLPKSAAGKVMWRELQAQEA